MTEAKNYKIIFYDKDGIEQIVKCESIEECIEMFKKKYDHFKIRGSDFSAVVIPNNEIIEYK